MNHIIIIQSIYQHSCFLFVLPLAPLPLLPALFIPFKKQQQTFLAKYKLEASNVPLYLIHLALRFYEYKCG